MEVNVIKTKLAPFAILLLSLLPLIGGTLFADIKVIPLIALLTIVLFYKASEKIQGKLFELEKQEGLLFVVFPFQGFIFLWSAVLVEQGRAAVFSRTLCLFIALILCAIWPILRKNRTRNKRVIPYPIVYSFIGFIIACSQLYLFLKAFL